jgi:hypothetical protein
MVVQPFCFESLSPGASKRKLSQVDLIPYQSHPAACASSSLGVQGFNRVDRGGAVSGKKTRHQGECS